MPLRTPDRTGADRSGRPLRRRLALATCTLSVPLLLVTGTPALAAAPAAGPAVSPSSDPVAAAADFLAGTVSGGQAGAAGPGATADAVSALVAAGTGRDHVPAMLDYLRGQAAAYAKTGTATKPGQAGKLLLAAGAVGDPGTSFGGVDLVSGLISRQRADGYFESPDTGQYAQSVFNHDLAVLGLAGVSGPPAAIGKGARFVAAQQCSDGSINSGAPTTTGCTDDGADGAALGVLALKAGVARGGVPASEVSGAVDKAMTYLASVREDNGGYGFGGQINANSTGLVLMAELATGRDGSQTRAALQTLRYDCSSSNAALRGSYQGYDDSIASAIVATNEALVPAAGAYYPVATRTPGSLSEAGTVDCSQPANASRVVALASPTRVLDTRSGTGAARGAVTGGVTIDLSSSVPASATAVLLNVTVTRATARSYVVAYPAGTSRPGTSNVNVEPGQTQANEATVALPADRRIRLDLAGGGSAQLIADLVGYTTTGEASGAGRLTPATPQRVLDTRKTATPRRTGAVDLDLSGVVATGTVGVVLNVTATGPTGPGYVTAYAGGTTDPGTSNVNFVTGQTQANEVVTRLGSNGHVTLKVAGSSALVVDLVATISPDAGSGSLAYVPLAAPARFLDTRTALGAPRGRVSGTIDVPLGSAVPAGAKGVVVNVTATNGSVPGYVVVTAPGAASTGTSNVNFPTSLTQANEVVTAVSADGRVTLRVDGARTPAANLVGDVVGYLVG